MTIQRFGDGPADRLKLLVITSADRAIGVCDKHMRNRADAVTSRAPTCETHQAAACIGQILTERLREVMLSEVPEDSVRTPAQAAFSGASPAVATGTVKLTVVPIPGALSTQIRP